MDKTIDLIGVGSPVIDSIANVSDAFVGGIEGEKGGMVLVDSEQLGALMGKIKSPMAEATGGSAGNAIVAACQLGTKVAFLGKVGNDAGGEFFKSSYAAMGAETRCFKVGTVPNARCLSLVTPDSQRTMRTDLGAAMTLTPDEITEADFADCRHAHIEGYLLFNEALMRRVLECAKAAGCTISVDLASFEVVKVADDFLQEWLEKYVDIVIANEDEAGAFFDGHGDDYWKMAMLFAQMCDIGVVKLGKKGSLIAKDGEVTRVAPVVVNEAVDTTGAGDYWAGGFLHAWLAGKPLAECGRHGSMLGAAVVQVMGATLEEHRWAEIRDALGK